MTPSKLPAEPKFVLHALGADEFNGRNRYQRWLRRIIRYKLRSPPFLLSTALWFSAVVGLYEPQLRWAALFFAILAVIKAGVPGQLIDAATVWAVWGNKETIPRQHWQPIAAHQRVADRCQDWLVRAVAGLIVSAGVIAIRSYGWGKGLIVVGALYLSIDLIKSILMRCHVVIFCSWQLHRKENLVSNYNQAWVGLTIAESRKKLRHNGDRVMLAFATIAIVSLQTIRPFSPIARVYVIIVVGLMLFSFASAIRNQAGIVRWPNYRIPRFPRISLILSLGFLTNTTIEVAWFAATLVALGPLSTKRPVLSVVATLVIFFVSRFTLSRGAMRVAKAILQRDFEIVYFRRFSIQAAEPARQLVAPLFGAYGRNVILWDKSLDETPADLDADFVDIFGGYWDSISCSAAEWQVRVATAVRTADLVVFHWEEKPTPSMIWEYREARSHLPGERLIWICSDPAAQTVADSIKRLLQEEQGPRHFITYSRNGLLSIRLRYKVYCVMKSLRAQRRF